MAKSKEILAAGVVRDIRFSSADKADAYLFHLDDLKITYKVLQSCRCDDGTVILRVLQRFNGNDLIQLYDY